jgi:hypothetical protein
MMVGFGGALAAAADANPYEVIWDRNIFHLNPRPVPEPPPPPKPPELPKVMLTGIVAKGSSIRVYLAISPPNKKETPYYTSGLLPGQKDHEVELLNIHPDKEEVDILNSGARETLSVESNSYASEATAAAPRPGGGAPRMPPGFRLPPGMVFPHRPYR